MEGHALGHSVRRGAMQTGACECHLETKDLTGRGRERHRTGGSEGRTGCLRRLEADAEDLLLGQRKGPYPAEDRVCPKARHWQSVEEEEIAQD